MATLSEKMKISKVLSPPNPCDSPSEYSRDKSIFAAYLLPFQKQQKR